MARGKLSGKQKNGFMWTDEKKFEVVTQYLATGSYALAAAISKVPEDTVRRWCRQDWWKSMEIDIKAGEDIELSKRLKTVVDKSLDAVIDRLESGDPVYNSRTGEIVRVPVKARDAIRALDSAVDKRQILNNQPTKITEQRTVDERLANLLAKFEQMGNGRIIEAEVQDAPEGS